MGEHRSHLESLLSARQFVVTTELRTTDSSDPGSIRKAAEPLRGCVDAINCTDNAAAHVHLSATAAAHLLIDLGLEPIAQYTCRDRNRLGLQADLLGAAALGIQNVCLMQGDDVSAGDHPEAKPLYDLDSMQAIRTARMMRDQGVYLSGRKLTKPPQFFVGAVENPFAPPFDFRPLRLGKKVDAGAEFIQLQICFNLPRLSDFMAKVRDLGLLEKVHILASVCMPRSARSARYMRDHVPGIDVPIGVVERLERVPEGKQGEESIRIGAEIVAGMRDMPGLSGVHVIAIKWEEAIRRLVETAGLLPRPKVALQIVNPGMNP